MAWGFNLRADTIGKSDLDRNLHKHTLRRQDSISLMMTNNRCERLMQQHGSTWIEHCLIPTTYVAAP